jgi:hypothetical protein
MSFDMKNFEREVGGRDMFWDRFKLLASLLIAVLMICVSANVIAINQNLEPADGSRIDSENSEYAGAATGGISELPANAELDGSPDPMLGRLDVDRRIMVNNRVQRQELDTIMHRPTSPELTSNQIEINTEDIIVKKVSPLEILERFQISEGVIDANPAKYLENIPVEPISIPVDEYQTRVFSPEEVLMMDAALASAASSEPDRTRGRADAGDTSGTATELFDGGDWIGDKTETHIGGNPPQYIIDDVDWFAVFMRENGNIEYDYVEIKIENTAPEHPQNTRQLHCYMWEPLAVMLNTSATILKSDGDISQKFIDAEIINPSENKTLNAAPPISGYFFIRLMGISDIDINYNITSVTITKRSPPDNNNYPDNGTIPQSNSVSNQQITQHLDHWDWYDISSFFKYVGLIWDNKIKYTVDITSEETGPGNDHSWTEVFVIYDDESGNSFYINGDERQTGGSPSRVGTEPITRSFVVEGANAWLGLRVWSMGVNQGNYVQHTFDGRANYGITSFSVDIVNTAPTLSQAKREADQEYYYLEDPITFKISYRDLDDNIPEYVNITIDGVNYKMASSKTNYASGVEYSLNMKANDFGLSPYPHIYNFSASDGLKHIKLELQSPNNEFKVIQNQTPNIFNSAPTTLSLKEDDDNYILSLEQVFEDADTTDGMDFYIKSGETFGKKFESPRMEVFITQNTKLKIQLKANQHGYDEVTVRAKETLKRDTDTYTFTSNHKINITVTPVNDVPEIEIAPAVQGYEDFLITIPISAKDPDILTDDDVITFSTNRSDGLGPDDLEGFEITVDEFDITKANITFTPINAHVGKLLVEVIVKDKELDEDTAELEIEVLNTNDDPIIVEVSTDETREFLQPEMASVEFTSKRYGAYEDEWFNMTIKIVDVDISIGESNDIEFNIKNSTFATSVDINHSNPTALSALVSFLPRNSDVGYNYINISVHDGKGGIDEVSIYIKTLNVNDQPDIPLILKPDSDNGTFSIVDEITFRGSCYDEDFEIPGSDEELTYIWQFISVDNNKVDVINTDTVNGSQEFSFKMRPLDRHYTEGQYSVKLVVRDNEKSESEKEISLTLSEDLDGDNILDTWEKEYGLRWTNRRDAMEDLDSDGYSNLEEFEAGTNPYNKNDHPSDGESAADYSWLIYIGIIVAIVIILLVLFMVIQKRKSKKAMEDIDQLAYPVEESFEMELAKPIPGQDVGPGMPGAPAPGPGMPPGMGMGMGMGMPGAPTPVGQAPGMPPQFMMMSPAQQMQFMQQMKMAQEQQKKAQGGQVSVGVGAGTAGTSPQRTQDLPKGVVDTGSSGTQLDTVSLKPQLPPSSVTSEQDASASATGPTVSEPDGRHAPIEPLSHDELSDLDIRDLPEVDDKEVELVSGAPAYLSESEVSEAGITDSNGEGYGNGDISGDGDEMKCPSCGVNVKSGWFLCPACKSPLN